MRAIAGLNRTKVELKRARRFSTSIKLCSSLNRTKVELKLLCVKYPVPKVIRLNRTKVELKQINAHAFSPNSSKFESNQSGIETCIAAAIKLLCCNV